MLLVSCLLCFSEILMSITSRILFWLHPENGTGSGRFSGTSTIRFIRNIWKLVSKSLFLWSMSVFLFMVTLFTSKAKMFVQGLKAGICGPLKPGKHRFSWTIWTETITCVFLRFVEQSRFYYCWKFQNL